MAADRTSVLVKFPADLLARVDAWSSRNAANRMAGILSLIEDGLGGAGPPPGPATKKSEVARAVAQALPALTPGRIAPKMDTGMVAQAGSAADRKAAYLARQGKRK